MHLNFHPLLKPTGLTLFFLGAGNLLGQTYQNVIEMVEIGENGDQPLIWTMPGTVASSGNDILVGEAVPENGAIFILSTIRDDPFKDWQLDQTAVGAYLPIAETTVVTHDLDSPISRTRADRPYRVQTTVSGLYDPATSFVDPADVQEAAKKVYLEFFAQSYPQGQNFLSGGQMSGDPYTTLVLEGNGVYPDEGEYYDIYTDLSPSLPKKARGEEHVIVHSLPDGTYDGGAIAQHIVQVWPVWNPETDGMSSMEFLPYSFAGAPNAMVFDEPGPVTTSVDLTLLPGETAFVGGPPEMTFRWKDLFPTSSIAIVVADAANPYPWGGRLVSGTRKVFNENGSFDYELTLGPDDWADTFSDADGRYAIWMLSYTPGIGWEVGGRNTGNGNYDAGGWIVPVKRPEIVFRGSLNSIEP